ncbi:MAG: 3-oxoacyl-ACP reductase family protein [Desulfatiglandaceae bacterium]
MAPQRKTALVTGSSRGIGKAIALNLAQQGARVVVNYKSSSTAAQDVVTMIKREGKDAVAIQADVSDEGAVKAMIDEIVQQFGGIDILVNNAALHRGGRVQLISSEDWDLVINSALRGTFHCCKYVVPQMVQRNWGRIINISSPAGIHGYPGDTTYGSAKAGLVGFTKSLAKEVATKGITANVVVPGYVQTDMTSVLFDTDVKIERAIQGIPMRRPGEPHEIAEVVGFLAFNASYVTGTVIMVDGGMGM